MNIKEKNIWTFPTTIEFDEVPNYSKKFEKIPHNNSITFDLSDTESIHSSFIGFLLNAKRELDMEQGQLNLTLSPSLEKFFLMMKLTDYFPNKCIRKHI